jgi:hypothetical protein
MYSIGVHRQGHVHPVVDQENGILAKLFQDRSFGQHHPGADLLGPVLHDPDLCCQSFFHVADIPLPG